MLQFERTDPPETKLAKLEQGLQTCRLPHEEVVPLFGALLAVPLPAECYAARSVSPQQQRNRPRMRWWPGCWRKPPGSRCWPCGKTCTGPILDHRAAGAAGRADPYRRHAARAHVPPGVFPALADALASDAITLNRLERLAGGGADCEPGGGKALPAEVVGHIVAKTDGVPLYVEELTKCCWPLACCAPKPSTMC